MHLGQLAARLDSPNSPVKIVNQADGFDWRTDTIDNHVHPNARGSEKMAAKWFASLTNLMDEPPQKFHPKIIEYKMTDHAALTLYIFSPTNTNAQPRPVVVFFYGGGWTSGTPIQFYPECAHFAARGFVANQCGLSYRVGEPLDALRERGRREVRHPLGAAARGGTGC